MFVVAGVSGNTGAVVAQTLLAAGKPVRVVVRDAAKGESWAARGAEVAVADLTDATALAGALRGAEGAYLLVPPHVTAADVRMHQIEVVDAFVEALTAAPVPHVAFLSSVGAHQGVGTGPIWALHYAEVKLSRLAGTRFTFVRAAYFMENTLGMLGAMKEHGVLPTYGSAEVAFPMIATHDIGATAAAALLNPPQNTQALELDAPELVSFAEVAAAYSAVLGKPIVNVPAPLDGVVPTFLSFGFSQTMAELYHEMIGAMSGGHIQFQGAPATRVHGKVGIQTFVRTALGG